MICNKYIYFNFVNTLHLINQNIHILWLSSLVSSVLIASPIVSSYILNKLTNSLLRIEFSNSLRDNLPSLSLSYWNRSLTKVWGTLNLSKALRPSKTSTWDIWSPPSMLRKSQSLLNEDMAWNNTFLHLSTLSFPLSSWRASTMDTNSTSWMRPSPLLS